MVVRAFVCNVIGEVFFHHTSPHRHGAQHRDIAVSVIGKSEDRFGEFLPIGVEDIEMNVVEILHDAGVVGVALHHRVGHTVARHRCHRTLDFFQSRSARG